MGRGLGVVEDEAEGKELLKLAESIINLRNYKEEELKREEGLIDIVASSPKTDEKILIRVVTRSKLKSGAIGVEQVKKMEKAMKNTGLKRAILIGKEFTSSAKREMRLQRIERVSEKAFLPFDLFSHEMVPRHEVLSREDAKVLLGKYRVKAYQLPYIKSTDPAIRAIGAKPGDVVRITRRSHTAGESIYYRYVIP